MTFRIAVIVLLVGTMAGAQASQGPSQSREPLTLAEDGGAALLALVEGVGRDPHNQPVTQRGGTLEDAQVSDMEHVERAEGDDGARHARQSDTDREARLQLRPAKGATCRGSS